MQCMPPKDIEPKDRELKEFRLEDTYMSPIKPEPISRYNDLDLCEIIWDKELQYEYNLEHITPDCGPTPPESPRNK